MAKEKIDVRPIPGTEYGIDRSGNVYKDGVIYFRHKDGAQFTAYNPLRLITIHEVLKSVYGIEPPRL